MRNLLIIVGIIAYACALSVQTISGTNTTTGTLVANVDDIYISNLYRIYVPVNIKFINVTLTPTNCKPLNLRTQNFGIYDEVGVIDLCRLPL
jgi:hypothetical protein